MRRHWSRSRYYIVGQGLVEDFFASGFNPITPAPSGTPRATQPEEAQPTGKYGRMFGEPKTASQVEPAEMIECLIKLGQSMNKPTAAAESDEEQSTLMAGYTYLGQFIAHELSFDKTEAPVFNATLPENFRSPQIDLDSLYGRGPEEDGHLYQDKARLKIGETIGNGFVKRTFLNDLPRAGYGQENPRKAQIADPRNDDNLALAQMHVAIAKFHNRVVDRLQHRSGFHSFCLDHPDGCGDKLFECARKEVIRHFHAIILSDYLPRILDDSGMNRVASRQLRFYNIKHEEGLFMPLEFSVAAFRFGHSMVRSSYEWNYFQSSERGRAPRLSQLFQFTQFSGDLGQSPRLNSDWIIDWRRFFDFTELDYPPERRKRNFARNIDTSFNLHLDQIPGYPHAGFPEAQRAITVRNLIRGYSLGVPAFEDVVGQIEPSWILTPDEIASGPHESILRQNAFRGRTPLWYYVLREAEVNNQRKNKGTLGPIGSCIVAETLLGLIMMSEHSILSLDAANWRPKFGENLTPEMRERRQYRMADLIKFADAIDPVGEYMGER